MYDSLDTDLAMTIFFYKEDFPSYTPASVTKLFNKVILPCLKLGEDDFSSLMFAQEKVQERLEGGRKGYKGGEEGVETEEGDIGQGDERNDKDEDSEQRFKSMFCWSQYELVLR